MVTADMAEVSKSVTRDYESGNGFDPRRRSHVFARFCRFLTRPLVLFLPPKRSNAMTNAREITSKLAS